ncbi:N-acetylneuraminate synthase [Flavihumibacter cheonanensis]|uniref:N-acetylneuraminate synthase n=1 Tax=Flavihumibacter cheonanensis TaxID=1442385 RepID=UPI001EF97512|nr:N-acetylneuraminate synthase [Flavihumibacter cheonanensis]MCG7753889.1 N-acetylneuraminate synthase [Flavihumibacter cheonanensis]
MGNKVLIIAEAGVNHNGDYNLAIELIDAAVNAGADFVKFQTFKAEKLVSKSALLAQYQADNLGNASVTQYEMLKKLEIPELWHVSLKEYAEGKGIQFLSTAFDDESIDFLDDLGLSFFKVPSGELTNKPYLIHIASKRKPVILSTGMADMSEIQDAIDVLITHGIEKKQITVLHCNTEYPTPMKDVNLLAMLDIKNKFNVQVGYSDHTLGIEVPIAAVALGACVIEKHFTLNRLLDGPDHKASLEPNELSAMVTAIRNVELATSGTGRKFPTDSELRNKNIARKSIHINKTVKKGHIISNEDLIMKRPGDGISPMEFTEVIGLRTKFELQEDTKLTWDLLER